jgi:ArsR family transcriptional regulator, lead/cadmium/zinc/bismuth-responsive transcriptional repressor
MSESMTCTYQYVHEATVTALQAKILPSDTLMDLSEFFKVFGDPSRLKILTLLQHAELCVCDLAALVEMSISAVSHQLKILRQHRLIRSRRDGKNVFYALADDHVLTLITQALTHLAE